MTNVTFTNHEYLVRSFDKNNNQVMDELQADARVKSRIDTDSNGEISRAELVSALRADAVEIKNGKIDESKGMKIFVDGLETLKGVHNIATNTRSWSYVWEPYMGQDDTGRERYRKLVDGNRGYESAINTMESALHSIKNMTANASDATSRALHIQAKTTLNSASWRSWVGSFQDAFSDGTVTQGNIRQLENANSNLKAAYDTMYNTLNAIAEQTKDLPDIESAAKATDSSIANAFANLNGIKGDHQSASDVSSKLNRIADAKKAQATGRAAPFAGIGAGIGLVGGGLVGFFAGGKTVKSALIGAGVGTAAAAGIGGLIGHSIDMKYLGESEALQKLAGRVTSYQVEPNASKLLNETQNTYSVLLNAREKHDLDNARVVKNDLVTIHGRVKPIEQESAEILSAYRMKE